MQRLMHSFVKTGVDFKTTGAILIGTTNDTITDRFIPVFVLFHVTTSTSPSAVPTISVGYTASGYTDLLTATSITSLSALNSYRHIQLNAAGNVSVPSNTGIYINISVGATGTALTGQVAIWGYYI